MCHMAKIERGQRLPFSQAVEVFTLFLDLLGKEEINVNENYTEKPRTVPQHSVRLNFMFNKFLAGGF